MIKKLFFTLLMLFSSIVVMQGQITLTTTSVNGSWSPQTVTKSGDALIWEASNGVIGTIAPSSQSGSDPVFDFSANDGTPIVITATSTDGFSGLTQLDLYNSTDGGLVTSLDVTNAIALTLLNTRYNQLSSLDVSQNTALTSLTVRGNNQLSSGVLDISNNPLLTFILGDVTQISTISLANNPLLTNVRLFGAQLTGPVMDQMVIDLDNHGLSDGNLQIIGNPGNLSIASLTAYNNLIAKNWTIDVDPAVADTEAPVIGILNAATSITSSSLSLNWTAGTDNIGITNYKIFKDGILEAQVANILTYNVTGLNPNTTYNFYITALDAAGNESLPSNTIAPTTLNASLGTTITLTTTSVNGTWSPQIVTKSGVPLIWEASNGLIGTIAPSSQTGSDPVFDFSANDGTPIVITATSSDGFSGLTQLDIYNSIDGGLVTSIDVSNATALTLLNTRYNQLSSLDVSQNSVLTSLTVRGNNQLSSGVLDISNNPLLTFIQGDVTQISTISLANNPLLTNVRLFGAQLTGPVMDQMVIDLDNHGLSNGNLQIIGNPGSLTSASFAAYTNLIAKNWTIDVPAPDAPVATGPEIDVQGNLVSILGDGTNVPSLADDTDFGADNIANTITKTFTIQNLGDEDLLLTDASPYVTITGADAADFSVSVLPTTPIAAAGSTTFAISFSPATAGIKTAIIGIANNDADEAAFNFNITAEGTLAAGPEINVVGNGISIISGNVPSLADDTDFGQVALGSSITKTFTIENVGDSNLTINFVTAQTAWFSFVPPFGFGQVIAPGTSTTIDVTFTPGSLGVQTGTITVFSDDTDENPYIVNVTAEGIAAPTNEVIEVSGNGIVIANNDFTADLGDDTNFGQINLLTTKTNTYTITNTGTDPLTITNIAFQLPSDAEFSVSNISPALGSALVPAGTMTFDVTFAPTLLGIKNAVVKIDNSDTENNPYLFSITGEGVEGTGLNDIMITQHYNGGDNNKWIEIKNISNVTIPANTYKLVYYNPGAAANITTVAPTASIDIPELTAGEVLLFRNAAAIIPTNLGGAIIIDATAVCSFIGNNDVIMISTTADATSFNNRKDILGSQTAWGQNGVSLVKGGCATETPHLTFVLTNWIVLTTDEVNAVDSDTNMALGTQALGSTTWISGAWNNGPPEQTRIVQISDTYTAGLGSIQSCDLTVSPGADLNLDGGTINSVVVNRNLTINGTVVIGDQESLVMFDDDALIVGEITKKENSTPRADERDFTYWSSPVEGAQTNVVFSGVRPERIFKLDQSQSVSSDYTTADYWKIWVNAPSEAMRNGEGYAAEGVAGTTGVHSIEFNGAPNNGIINMPIVFQGDVDPDNDYNLLGNPYPSAIDLDVFLNAQGNIDKSIYLWTHISPIGSGYGDFYSLDFLTSDYASYNLTGGVASENGGLIPTNNLGSSQGFMLRAISGGSVVFNNGMRMVDANDQFFKQTDTKNKAEVSEEKDRIWLNMTTNQGGFNQILIGFMEKATEAYDNGYDARTIVEGNPVVFYSVLDNDKYTIQGLGAFNQDKTIALGFDANVVPRMYKVSIEKVEGALKGSEIYLVDNLLGITHDLNQGDYEFEVNEYIEDKERFSLQFKGAVLDVDTIVTKQDFVVSNQNAALRINSKEVVKSIRVYDVLGRLLINERPNKQVFDLNTSAIKGGTVLILEATLENGATVNRKTINF